MNRAGLRMMGVLEEAAICGLPYLSAVAEADRERIGRLLELARQGQASEFEFQATNGSLFQSSFVPITNAQGAVLRIMGLTQDITARRQAEAALRESEERYRLLADYAEDFVTLNDTEGGRLYVSPSFYRVTGWPKEAIQGTGWRSRAHPDDLPLIERTRAANLAGETTTLEHRIRCADGRWLWVESRCKPILGRDGKVEKLLVWGRDITARKQAEQLLAWEMSALELVASAAPLAEALDGLMLGLERQSPGALCSVLLLDAAGVHLRHGAGPSLPGAYNQLIDGVAIGPAVGSCGTAAHTNRQVIVTDIGRDPLWANYRELALAHGLRACWSTPIHSSHGLILGTFAIYYRDPRSPVPVELELIERAKHIVGLAIERKQATAAVFASQRMLQLILDNIPQGVFWKDRDSRYLGCNAVVARTFGVASAASLLGKSDLEFGSITSEQAAFFVQKDREVMESNRPQLGIIEPSTFADGRTRWLETNKLPLHSPTGEVIGVLGTWQDITERKEAVEVLQRRAAELERFHRLSVGRELQMIDLKKEINALAQQAGRTPPYDLSFLEKPAQPKAQP